jgi:hypothetical protein
MANTFLSLMNGTVENDNFYLSSDEKFSELLPSNLKSDCNEERIIAFICRLHDWPTDQLQDRRFIATLDVQIYAAPNLLLLTRENRNNIKIILYSCILREYILKVDSTAERTEYWRMKYLAEVHSDLLSSSETKSLEMEMILLTRHFRAVHYLSKILSGQNHKEMFLTIGYILEGSGKYHGSGGNAGKARDRRVYIFEHVTGVKPRIRRKNSEGQLARSRSASVSTLPFERNGFTPVDHLSEGLVTPTCIQFSSSFHIRTPSTNPSILLTTSSLSSSILTVPSYDRRDEGYSNRASLSEEHSPIKAFRMTDAVIAGNNSTSDYDNNNSACRPTARKGFHQFSPPSFPFQEFRFQTKSDDQVAAFEPVEPVEPMIDWKEFTDIMISDNDSEKEDELNRINLKF